MNGEAKRIRLDQRRAPIHEALENFRRMRLWPGTSKGTTRIRRKFSSASWMGARRWSSRVRFVSPFIFTSVRGPLAK